MTTITRVRHHAPLTRRVRDSAGNEVTYLTLGEAARVSGVGPHSIDTWFRAGLIRTLPSLRGSGKGYSLVDIARLRLMSRARREELGIFLTSEETRKKGREYYEQYKQRTMPAEQHYELWDDYDYEFLMDEFTKGTPLLVIARALGRTYQATELKIKRLRDSGDLPPFKEGDDASWKARTLELLTTEEIAMLLEGV